MYLLGRTRTDLVWAYFPLAVLFKWPLGFLGALALGAAYAVHRGLRSRAPARRAQRPSRRAHPLRSPLVVLLPAVLFLLAAMFLVRLPAGVRYLLPVLPMLCIALGALGAHRGAAPARPAWRHAAMALALLQAVETATIAPYFLSFFNRPSGGPGAGQFLVNDSNIDWGQGLIALKDELRRRGIGRVHLAYHGTAEASVYGIDYVPYLGGTPGPESDWIAISSYYYVGLRQRMMTPDGLTDPIEFDFRPQWSIPPTARPAGCMLLYRVRGVVP
jgi:hypothetical protein